MQSNFLSLIFIPTHCRICAQHETLTCLLLPVVDNIRFFKSCHFVNFFTKHDDEMTPRSWCRNNDEKMTLIWPIFYKTNLIQYRYKVLGQIEVILTSIWRNALFRYRKDIECSLGVKIRCYLLNKCDNTTYNNSV